MVRDPSKECKWSDTDLATAVTASRSWRGVMRELGLCVTPAGSLRVVKRRVALLGLDTSHFTGQRPWSDAALSGLLRKPSLGMNSSMQLECSRTPEMRGSG